MTDIIDERTAHRPGLAEVTCATDGRALRRYRNIVAVRVAVVELLEEGAELSIPVVAERAGVAGRSVYRYYGDLDGAIRDAVTSRLDEMTRRMPEPTTIDPTTPLDARIAHVSRGRVEMWARMNPVLRHLPDVERKQAMRRFDDAVIATFAPELAQFAAPERDAADSTLAVMVCLHTIDSLAGRCERDVARTTAALSFALRRLLAPAV